MRADDLKEWLRGMERGEFKGVGDHLRLLVKLCQHVWETGEIPRQMLLTTFVLIPK